MHPSVHDLLLAHLDLVEATVRAVKQDIAQDNPLPYRTRRLFDCTHGSLWMIGQWLWPPDWEWFEEAGKPYLQMQVGYLGLIVYPHTLAFFRRTP